MITEDEEAKLNEALAQLRNELKWRRTADMVKMGTLYVTTALAAAATMFVYMK